MYETDRFDEEGSPRPNKSQLKREAAALFELGKRLVELEHATLHTLELPEKLLLAIDDARDIHSHTARKRQLKLIGKFLRSVDTTGLLQLIEKRDLQHRKSVSEFHHIEKWRDRLIHEGAPAMSELLDRYPDVERQKLNQLVRNAVREMQSGRSSKSARQLFKFLREQIQ